MKNPNPTINRKKPASHRQTSAIRVFALIDCNNFFVSCERLFRPDLETKPVVILSSNDGCVVARSNEAKAIGIPMGAPAFKHKELFQHHKVQQFSASFELYGNISRRITNLLSEITPNIEVYSIDESFLDISSLSIDNYRAWALHIRQRILQEIGIPVSIGIAPSKTLAKLASEIAKQQPLHQGAFSFLGLTKETKSQALASVPVQDIWGVGRRLAPRLKSQNIHTGLDLSHMAPRRAQQLLSINGRQMVAELNGTSCFPLEKVHKQQKSIMRGRTFGEDTNSPEAIESIIASMAARAAFRLREEHQATLQAAIFIETSRHRPGYRRWYKEITFSAPTTDNGNIIASLTQKFSEIYETGQLYHRLNVYLFNLMSSRYLQTDILGATDVQTHDAAQRRMEAVDTINNRFGRGHIHYATENLNQAWQPRRKLTAPHYISNWDELPTARIVQ
jgi:DNA polymerase V